MNISHPLLHRLGGFAISKLVQTWVDTLQIRIAAYDLSCDPADVFFRGPVILVFWHEYIALPFGCRGHCRIAMLLSRHRDAEWLHHAADISGYKTIRGSSFRGGGKALKELVRTSRDWNLAITPDGPRGPRRVMAPGPVFLASKLRLPMVLMGFGYDRPWRMNSWDRFALPRPFSQVRVALSPRISLPENLDRDGVEHYRQVTERLLNRLTLEAEAWAAGGGRKAGDRCLIRQPLPLMNHWYRQPPAAEGSGASPARVMLPSKSAVGSHPALGATATNRRVRAA